MQPLSLCHPPGTPALVRCAASLAVAAAVAAPGVAHADEPWGSPPWAEPDVAEAQPAPRPEARPLLVLPRGPLGPNVVTYPNGSVAVTRTAAGGVDVHAQTAAGTVHAYGCDRVELDARTATGAPPPPCSVMPYAYPYLPHDYPYPVLAPYAYPLPTLPRPKPKYAPDPARTGALVASSVVFGLGTAITGGAFFVSVLKRSETTCDTWGTGACTTSRPEPNTTALYAMGGIMTVTPSIPRYVVGSVGLGLLFTSLRGGSFAAGAFIDWKDKSGAVPATFAFVIPLALGIVDLATTPHREELEGRPQPAARRKPSPVELAAVGPSAIPDQAGNLAPSLAAMGRF